MSLPYILLFVLISAASVFLILYLANRRVGERYKQYWNPIVAIIYVLIAVYVYLKSANYVGSNPMLQFVMEALLDLQQSFGDYVEVMYGLVVAGMFATTKMTVNEVSKLFGKKEKKKDNQEDSSAIKAAEVDTQEKQENPIPRFSLAYKLDGKGNVVLRKEWAFPNLFFRYFSIVLSVVFTIILIAVVINWYFSLGWPHIPSFISLSLLVSLEIHWYLKHPSVEQHVEETKAAVVKQTQVPQDYYNLWEEYQKVWSEKLLLAWHYKSRTHEAHSPTTIQVIEAQNLVNAGYKLSMNDYHILERLKKRNDMLIDDVIIDNVAPLLFSVFLRRLMDGENILVLTPQRCYDNSNYHELIVNWISNWFHNLTTNREFWQVQIFSRTKDVDLSSRIIVSSAEDMLEKDITDHEWFSHLKTILYLNGEEIFTETLTTNNILLNILRSKLGSLQSIVLSNYREALQSSVMRNLDVKSDLKEIRMERRPPQSSFAIFWKLEGTQLFQSQLLSGYIEKYLGAEAALTLLARRERIANITMVGQDELPYYEYLEEMDNSKGSLREKPVHARTLKYKGVNEVNYDTVNFLMPQRDKTFILARDNEYNVITALKKWESFATDMAFVHVISPPYLLRDYLIDNVEYFSRTPLYALSAKKMISRFEVARTLLERMVHQELSESEILEELNWINPNAVFVKHELHELFRLAFGIDIVSSNYLSIRSAYEFDKNANTYKKVTQFKLQPRIKDNINLVYLKNVEVVDQARNVLKIISNDLVFQNYLPEQTHAFNGKPYNVRGFDRFNYKLRVNHRSPDPSITYRPDIEINLKNIAKPLTESHRKNPTDDVHLALCEGNFEVMTKGYFTFLTGISLQRNDHTYTTVRPNEVPVRAYQLGRIAVLVIDADESFDIAKVTATLSILLNELMYTLFPEMHQYIWVGSTLNELVYEGAYGKLYPNIKIANAAPTVEEKTIQLCILEDAHQDLGLVQSFYDKWDYVLRLADDYLGWLSKEKETPRSVSSSNNADDSEIFRKHKIDKATFLKFGEETYPELLDIEGTSRLLRKVLGNNYLSSQRKKFYGLK